MVVEELVKAAAKAAVQEAVAKVVMVAVMAVVLVAGSEGVPGRQDLNRERHHFYMSKKRLGKRAVRTV